MTNLRITIPTYNRPDYIQRQIRDLLPQLQEGVSIVVYDNCSDIPVSTLFTKEELDKIEIHRNQVNVGGQANLGNCISWNAEYDWIWLLSDDDKISSNAVSTILETINKNQNCCYINFEQKKTAYTTNFADFLNYLTIFGAFGISFFQSACILNMNKLRPFVRYYYEFLSSWIGQIALVIKFLEENNNEHCLFTSTKIIDNCNIGGWNHLDLIVNSSIFVDRFRHLKPIMKDTLFKALGDMDFTLLTQEVAPLSTKRYYRKYIFKRFGFWNILKYNRITFVQYLLSVLLPTGIFEKIRNFVASKYNKKVSL